MKILTAEQMREIDRLSTAQYGIPGILLMENAAMRVVEVLEGRFENLEELSIGILCGKGNNGGDGFAVARQLIQRGCYPSVFLFAEEDEVKGDARTNLEILKAIGHSPTVVVDEDAWDEEKLAIIDADIVIDALLGTGLTQPVKGIYKAVIESLEDCARATIVSIDLPSGLPTNDSRPVGPAVTADLTITFTALKPCLVFAPSHDFAGDVVVSDIGNPAELLESAKLNLELIDETLFPEAGESRDDQSNKGDFGKVLIIAGSRGKSGAAVMAGQAALRSGAGLVTVASASSALPVIAASMPELMTEALTESADGSIQSQDISAILAGKTLLAIGPGLTTAESTSAFVRAVVQAATIPVVIDADGLNAFAGKADQLRGTNPQIVLTPHPGEMARLIGRDIAFVLANRLAVARDFAVGHKVYLVLKGFRTLVAGPGGSIFVNPTGNPGMATGGTGDILTGMIAGILAQPSLGAFVERLCLAVYLHGLAGDLAAAELGEESMLATDILRFLPAAWKTLARNMREIVSTSEEQTLTVARELTLGLPLPAHILLHGDLGAGKTLFTKGLAEAFGVADPTDVTSPTFTLVNQYSGRIKVYHIDLYRIENGLLDGLGLEEILDEPNAAVIIEWAERLGNFEVPGAVRVFLTYIDEHTRGIAIS